MDSTINVWLALQWKGKVQYQEFVDVKNWNEGPYNVNIDSLNLKRNNGVLGEWDHKRMTSSLVESEAGFRHYRGGNKHYVISNLIVDGL